MGWWVTDVLNSAGPMVLIAWVFWVIFSICLHELGHGWAAIRHGDRTPIETGHMTWNPLVHMGQMSLLMFAIVGIAWGAMPVNPSRMRGRHADAIVSAAGPAMNVGLFLVASLGAALVLRYTNATGYSEFDRMVDADQVWVNVHSFFQIGAFLNVALLFLNLLPVMPLDGGRLAAHFIPAYRRLWAGPNAGIYMVVALIAVIFLAGRYLFPLALDLTAWMVGFYLDLLP